MFKGTLLVLVVLLASLQLAHCAGVTGLSLDGEEDTLVVSVEPVADVSRRPVTPTSLHRVGPWLTGRSFDSDQQYFAPYDAAYEKWFVAHQKELQKQKQEEARRRHESRKKAKEAEEGDAAFAVDAIARRSKTRRAVLKNAKQPLLTKVQTVMVDVRGFARRLHKLFGGPLANRTLRDDEVAYQEMMAKWSQTTTDEHLSTLVDYAKHTTDDLKGNETNSSNTVGLHSFPKLQAWVWHAQSTILSRVTFPYPVLVVGSTMLNIRNELRELLVDVDKVHKDTTLATHGLLAGEEDALRQARLKPAPVKARLHPEGDDSLEVLEDAARAERALAKSQRDADAKEQERHDAMQRRHAERLVGYNAMEQRLRLKGQQFLRQVRDVILPAHRIHQEKLMVVSSTALARVQELLPVLLRAIDTAMAANDQSTKLLERQMKALQKAKRRFEDELQELRTLRPQLSPSDGSAISLRTFVKLFSLSATVRLGGLQAYMESLLPSAADGHAEVMALVAEAVADVQSEADRLSSIVGLTPAEVRYFLVIPFVVLAVVLILIQLLDHFVVRRAIGACANRVNRRLQRTMPKQVPRGHIEPFRIGRFLWQVLLTSLRLYPKLITSLNALLPVVLPLCVVDYATLRYLLSVVLPVPCASVVVGVYLAVAVIVTVRFVY